MKKIVAQYLNEMSLKFQDFENLSKFLNLMETHKIIYTWHEYDFVEQNQDYIIVIYKGQNERYIYIWL